MDAKTRKVLISVCVLGFLLTSTYSWGILSGFIDSLQIVITEGGGFAKGSIVWILAHLNAFVPLIFVGVIIWIVKQKTKTGS